MIRICFKSPLRTHLLIANLTYTEAPWVNHILDYNRSHHFSQCMLLCNWADLSSCNDVHKILKLATTITKRQNEAWITLSSNIVSTYPSIFVLSNGRKILKQLKVIFATGQKSNIKLCFHFIDFVTKYSELISRNLYSCIFKETKNKCNFILKVSIKIPNTFLSVNIIAQKHLRFYYEL